MKVVAGGNIVYISEGKKIVDGKDTGRPAVVVGVVKKKPLSQLSKREIIPKKINGVETDVIEVGGIPKALTTRRTGKWRPAPGGVSVGHVNVTAGTLGMKIQQGDKAYILSNNHVLAHENKAEIGDPILQPGAYDGGTILDKIGTLAKFVPIEVAGGSDCPFFNIVCTGLNGLADFGCFIGKLLGLKFLCRKTRINPTVQVENIVDCALAEVASHDVTFEILGYGEPAPALIAPQVNMNVKKSGRTTELTEGIITSINATVQVMMTDGIAIFTDQIIMTKMLEGGDSGSVLLNKNNGLVGLCFAGSDTMSIANKMTNVFAELGIEVKL